MIDVARGLYARAFAELERRGVLMKADATLPSVTTLAAGAPIRGSWWGHPKAHHIFAALEQLADNPDAALTKLVAGKDTFVHRRLWPALAAAALDADPIRRRGLSKLAYSVLRRVEEEGSVLADAIPARDGAARKARTAAIKELESRLLLLTSEFHTERGAHAKRLQSWAHWARERGVCASSGPTPERARLELEDAVGISGVLWPWRRTG